MKRRSALLVPLNGVCTGETLALLAFMSPLGVEDISDMSPVGHSTVNRSALLCSGAFGSLPLARSEVTR